MQGHNNNDHNGGIIGAHGACAPCKHQRKKCTADCVLAPYFPSDKNHEFQSVRRICGVKILTKMVENVEMLEDRRRLAEAMIWVAGCWDEDPVQGALGKYRRSQQEVEELKREIVALRESLNNQTQQHQFFNGKPPGPGLGNGWPSANNTPTNLNFQNNNGSNRNMGIPRSSDNNNNNALGYGRPMNGYMGLHHQEPFVVAQQNYHLQQQQQLKLQQQQQQLKLQQPQLQKQQYSPNGYTYYVPPGQFNGNIIDDTHWGGRP